MLVVCEDFNGLESTETYQMPVFFISGTCDWVCPADMVEEYIDVITAPKKEIYLSVLGAAVGCAGLKAYSESDVEIKRVWVDPEFRGKHISTVMMDIVFIMKKTEHTQ